jgi:tRNA A37 threonylcarbamoyladenosine synthetase subunit TsaC/SUA5/YrdC
MLESAESSLAASTIEDARAVYAIVSRGGLALVPTDVGYGLLAMGEEAVDRIYELKGRPRTKPCVTVVNASIFDDVVLPLAPVVRAWIDDVARRTPLAVVARLNERSRLLAAMPSGVRSQATQAGTIATFHSAGRIVEGVAALAHADGRLVLGSSANTAGTGNNASFVDVPESMRRGVDLALDRGPAWYANEQRQATTILDVTRGEFLRRGVNFTPIERSWKGLALAG